MLSPWTCGCGARRLLVGSFLNLSAVADWLARDGTERLLIVCSGTHEEAAYEDVLGAGALCDAVWAQFANGHLAHRRDRREERPPPPRAARAA